ncbi:hypothetical protein DCAR_0104410 [Daucus carota subsp. sativus]|uniref:Uncharacterized protein n=2 Tax=Apioideae TaxID=241778 RepID=A0AAF0W8G5_DAUCS|nr:hypothetical protein DCAR_0104410 [Daucus carota subsp. sativus]
MDCKKKCTASCST